MNQVLDFLINLFKYSDFHPFWKNGSWTDFHGWLYIVSDLLVWSSYFILPVLIIRYVRKQGKKVHFNGLYVLFASFILVSGATYLIDALMFWVPLFRVGAVMRLATGIISWVTVFYVFKVLPTALSLKSPMELQDEIEKRVQAETAMKLQHDRLLEAERTAKLGYGSWDIYRKHIALSDMACEIMGIAPGTILSYEKLITQVHPADLRFIEDSVQKNLRATTFKPFYFRVLTDRMVVKHVLVRGEVSRNANGHAIEVKGTIQDVSEMRSHVQRIEQQNKRLKKIAWVQSHRMRSPVATLLGLCDLFNHDDPADPMNAEILANIREQSKALDEMIHEVDDLTRDKPKQLV